MYVTLILSQMVARSGSDCQKQNTPVHVLHLITLIFICEEKTSVNVSSYMFNSSPLKCAKYHFVDIIVIIGLGVLVV